MRRFFTKVFPKVKARFSRGRKNYESDIVAPPVPVNLSADSSAANATAAGPQEVPQAPLTGGATTYQGAGTAPTLQTALVNHTGRNVNCYVTGQAISHNYAVYLLQSDGVTPYYPTSPASTGGALAANCAIPLAPGNTKTITIPQTAGGRIWFSIENTLTFLLNPGPSLVEPSVTNDADPNINISWAFAEFTYNSSQLYANITYVDFVAFPIALSLTNTSGRVITVAGMSSSGFDTICSNLQKQSSSDGVSGWQNLIGECPSWNTEPQSEIEGD